MSKALVVSPYLDHLGGGERYMLSCAAVLEELGYKTYFAWDNLTEINVLAEMLGITLKSPGLDASVKPLYFSRNPLGMWRATQKYDVVIYLSDGSLPLLGGHKNIVHMQVPFHDVGGNSWKNQVKKRCIHRVIVNSQFTKHIVDHEYHIRSTVIYPPVKTTVKKNTKENMILSVGRFEPSLNAKKQDIMIEAFAKLAPRLPGWKLVLAGASTSDDWLTHLKKLAGNHPIEFAVNAKFTYLSDLYSRASIYWHAAGYGIDEDKNPELVEHFGITTVEAVAAGSVPLVFPVGGQREILGDTRFHWLSQSELIRKTIQVAKDDRPYTVALKNIDLTEYSQDSFTNNLRDILI